MSNIIVIAEVRGGSLKRPSLEAVTAERDQHLADLQRISAEFANFKKQTEKRNTEFAAQAALLVAAERLLGVTLQPGVYPDGPGTKPARCLHRLVVIVGKDARGEAIA